VTNRIFFKLLASFLLVIAAGMVPLGFSLRHAWESSLRAEIERNLQQKAVMFAHRVQTDRGHSLQEITSEEGQAAGARATVIDARGKVLADSEMSPGDAENEAGRPEFAAALAGKIGQSTRGGGSLQLPFLYISVPISGGAVRLAYSMSDLQSDTISLRRMLLFGIGASFVVAVLVAALMTHFLSRRLQRIVDFAGKISAGDLSARIDDNAGDEIGKVASALDKTARQLEENFSALQNSRHQLETLLNSMQDAVIAVGADDRVQWANHSMDALVPQRTRLHVPLVETVRDPEFLRAVHTASVQRQATSARATSILPSRTFDVTAAPLPAGGAVAVLRDLTEVERVEKTRRDFIANVSHELRTPLTSIQGYTETLLDVSEDGDHSREFLEIIRKNAMRISRLTEDLLTLARVESGEQRFEMQAVVPRTLLEDALESFQEIAAGQGIQLLIEDAAETPVEADREAMHQVFSNLVDNALKYGGTGGGKVVLGAHPCEHGVEFYVRDFGGGIPSEHLPRLFERFYRVDKARSRESGGTGLGLAIAKHIVLAHRGSIRAESELNHGSTFLFILPAAVPA
jgi:two-component system, OmpR family, phosphate regulon sensor histidine kinase PhoR